MSCQKLPSNFHVGMMNALTHDLDIYALNQYFCEHAAPLGKILSSEKFAGGQSNPTFKLETTSGNYVLRRQPPGKLLKSAHAVDREYRVMTALKNSSVPVPAVHLLCEDNSIIGSKFFIMDFLDGQIFWDPGLPGLTKYERKTIFFEMLHALTELHKIDINKTGLSDFGRPGNYFARQLDRWTKQYRVTETETIPEMGRLIEWLPNNLPEDDGRVTLIHGDFRLDNIMFDHKDLKPIALLDWELSTLGQPYADLAYQCMQLRFPADWPLAGLGNTDRVAAGIPTEQEYITSYCQRVGIDTIPHWKYYLIFSFFRFAASMQGLLKRTLDGNASNENAEKLGNMVKPAAKMACQILDEEDHD